MSFRERFEGESEVSESAQLLVDIKNSRFHHDPFGKHIFTVERGKKFVRYLFRNNPEILAKLDIDNLTLGQTSFTDKKLTRHTADIHFVIPIIGDVGDTDPRDCVV
jgi:hypothetical protein